MAGRRRRVAGDGDDDALLAAASDAVGAAFGFDDDEERFGAEASGLQAGGGWGELRATRARRLGAADPWGQPSAAWLSPATAAPTQPPRPLRPIETTKVGIIDTPYQRRNGYHVEVTVQHPDVSPTKHRLWVSHEARARNSSAGARFHHRLLTPLPATGDHECAAVYDREEHEIEVEAFAEAVIGYLKTRASTSPTPTGRSVRRRRRATNLPADTGAIARPDAARASRSLLPYQATSRSRFRRSTSPSARCTTIRRPEGDDRRGAARPPPSARAAAAAAHHAGHEQMLLEEERRRPTAAAPTAPTLRSLATATRARSRRPRRPTFRRRRLADFA